MASCLLNWVRSRTQPPNGIGQLQAAHLVTARYQYVCKQKMTATLNISSYVYDLPWSTTSNVLWQYYNQYLHLNSTPLHAIAGSVQACKQNMPSSKDISNYVYDLPWSSAPHVLWRYYIQYLWNYDSTSWVARVSSTIRVLAVLLILPVAILGMLVCLILVLLLGFSY